MCAVIKHLSLILYPLAYFLTVQSPSVPTLFNSLKFLQLNVIVFVACHFVFYRSFFIIYVNVLHLSYNYNKMYIGFDIKKRKDDVDNFKKETLGPMSTMLALGPTSPTENCVIHQFAAFCKLHVCKS